MTNEFDLKAREWDKNQMHVERASAIARAMEKIIPLNKHMKALEFGAGTGLLSFLLADRLAEITLMDNSTEMINVVKGKISGQEMHHMKPVLINLEQEDYPEHFDIIYSQMVLHHVNDTSGILKKFYKMLTPGGYLAIADLYTEDGSFHGDGFTGHKGFDVEILANELAGNGFKNITHHTCFIVQKITEQGTTKNFPVFLIAAKK
jgi:2-polyprenyl-3-methyl-5-hydroxy-6-metoxy-1,4-benzoquinol methylase